MWSNKITYNVLYNFEDIIVFRFLSRSSIQVSSIVRRTASASNLDELRTVGTLSHPYPTPLSVLVALATLGADRTMASDQFPKTSDLTRQELDFGGKDFIPPVPDQRPQSPRPPLQPDSMDTGDIPYDYHLHTREHYNGLPLPKSFLPKCSACTSLPEHLFALWPGDHAAADSFRMLELVSKSDRSDTSHHGPRSKKMLATPVHGLSSSSVSRYSSQLKLFVSKIPTGEESIAPISVALGAMRTLAGVGRLWEVYAGIWNGEDVWKRGANVSHLMPASTWSSPHSTLASPASSTSLSVGGQSSSSQSDTSLGSPVSSAGSSPRRLDIDVVFKFAVPSGMCDLPLEHLDEGEYSSFDAMRAIMNEARLYQTRLSPLEGIVVPRFFGLYCSSGDVWSMILQNVGPPIVKGEMQDIPARKR